VSSAVDVAVLGAGGTIAPAIVRDLAESEEIGALRLLDIDADRARATGERHGLDKWQASAVDARSGLAEMLDGCFVLVNTASYRVNLDAMRACLSAGCHYIDLGGLYWTAKEQFELGDEFERAGLLALLGMGSSPGKTNVMAAAAVQRLTGDPESIVVAAAGRDLSPPATGLSVPYALRTLIDELTIKPVVVTDGSPAEVDPMTPSGSFDFGNPIGNAATFYTLHSEVLTFPPSFGAREVSFNLSLAEALIAKLRTLTDAGPAEIDAAAKETSPPSANTVSAHVIEASNAEQTVRVLARTRPLERWGIGGGVVSTGTPASAAVRLMCRGKITASGALPPERCVAPGDLFPELEQRGCSFEIDSKETVGA